jgi:hypothetical protein
MAPPFTANEIKIRVVPDGEQHSKATITYRRSALAPERNDEVANLDAHWAEQHRIPLGNGHQRSSDKGRHS